MFELFQQKIKHSLLGVIALFLCAQYSYQLHDYFHHDTTNTEHCCVLANIDYTDTSSAKITLAVPLVENTLPQNTLYTPAHPRRFSFFSNRAPPIIRLS